MRCQHQFSADEKIPSASASDHDDESGSVELLPEEPVAGRLRVEAPPAANSAVLPSAPKAASPGGLNHGRPSAEEQAATKTVDRVRSHASHPVSSSDQLRSLFEEANRRHVRQSQESVASLEQRFTSITNSLDERLSNHLQHHGERIDSALLQTNNVIAKLSEWMDSKSATKKRKLDGPASQAKATPKKKSKKGK